MIYIITFAFIVLDITSGLIKSFILKKWSSSIMREGLFHKTGFLLVVVLAILCDYGQRFLSIGINIPITETVCTYVTEIGSIIENLALINPELIPEKLKGFFLKIQS